MQPEPGAPLRGALVLVVEDEPSIASVVVAYLEREGYRARTCADGETALTLVATLAPRLVVLDVRLPGIDGFEVLRRLRVRSATPVILVTARDHEVDRVSGLRLGADDYVVKPFSPAELAARVTAVLRRSEGPSRRVLDVAGLRIDPESRQVQVGAGPAGRGLQPTRVEFELLLRLALAAPRVVRRDELLGAVDPDSLSFDRSIDTHLYNLRRKLRDAGAGDVVQTVRGVGYRIGGP